ncbi:MAG: fimbria/pilus outer membrane usher protein [Candidatus Dasytiphilus stammeri]
MNGYKFIKQIFFLLIIFLLSINFALGNYLEVIPAANQLYLELVLNGIDTGKIIRVNLNNGHYYIRLKELRSAGLIIPNNIKLSNFIAIDEIKDVHIQYEIKSQKLIINVPFFWFPKQKIFLSNQKRLLEKNIPSQSNFGWLFNYNFYFHRQFYSYKYNIGFLTFWSELRVFSKWGVLSNTSSWSNELSKPFIRYDTHWDINDEKHLVSYIIGDSITDTLFGSIPLRIGGIKLFRNFSLCPDLITYPLPTFYSQTVEPSKVDLYINNSQIMSAKKINPGPFILIDAIPNLQGASKAKIVIFSPNKKKINLIPFYVTSELLKKGLTNFSLSLGLLREDYGINSMNYSHLIASGMMRHGIKSWLTLEGKMEVNRDLLNYGVGANIKPMMLGVVNISWSRSGITNNNIKSHFYKSSLIPNNRGQKISIGYNYNNTYFNLSALHSFSNYNYSNLSDYKFSKAKRHVNNLSGSINFGNYGNLSLGLINTWNNKGKTNRFFNLSYSITLPKTINLLASINKKTNHPNFNAQLMLTLPLNFWGNGNTSLSSTVDDNENINSSQIWSNKITTNNNAEIGWNLMVSQNAKDNKYHEANFFWKNRYFENRFGIFGDFYNNENSWIEFEGSLVNIAGHIYVTQPIYDAFVLVSTKGYGKIPVFYENQFVGKTNRLGYLLIPTITGWYRSKFDINPLKLPVDVIATETTKKIPIKEHSGYLIEFDIHKFNALLFSIVDKKGNYLPNGSIVKIKGTSIVTWLGWQGQVWIEGFNQKYPKLTITRSDNGKSCHVRLPIKTFNGILNLGKQVCQ